MDNDDELAALIDGELDDARKRALLAQMADDPALRRRYEALVQQRAAVEGAFQRLLGEAPLERLRSMIPPETRRPTTRFGRIAFRELAAGLVVGLVLSTAILHLRQPSDDWRSAVVDYMDLYTNETFAGIPADATAREQELAAVGERVGVKLTPAAVSLSGLSLKTAFILAYDNAPLAEVVQVDPAGAPVLFCVLADGRSDAPLKTETRDRFSLASWSRGGKGYLVIASLPVGRIAGYAREVEARF